MKSNKNRVHTSLGIRNALNQGMCRRLDLLLYSDRLLTREKSLETDSRPTVGFITPIP